MRMRDHCPGKSQQSCESKAVLNGRTVGLDAGGMIQLICGIVGGRLISGLLQLNAEECKLLLSPQSVDSRFRYVLRPSSR